MASEIRVDKINSLSGVGTVTLSPTGVDIAGITTAATLRATTGIVTSLTAVSSAKVGSGVTLSPDGDIFATGVTTSTTFVGNLTGNVTGTASGNAALTGSTNNTVTTVTGANAIQGEANLTFDGDTLLLKSSTDGRRVSFAGDGTSHYMKYDNTLGGIILNGYGGITFETNGTNERLRIDSSGRLLLGTTTEGQASADDLTIATSGNTGITLRSGTSNAGNIYFSDATSGTAEYAGYVSYSHSTNALSFGTNDGTERFVIKSDGTSYALGDFGGGTNSPQSSGLTVENSSEARLRVRAGSNASNGEVAIRADGGNTQLGTWSDHDCKLVRNTAIQASIISNGIQLPDGKSINFGNTIAAAHQLDDYEEGSYTPVMGGSGWSYSRQVGYYRKIGTLVHVSIWITGSGGPNDGSTTTVSLPFTSYSASSYRGGISGSWDSSNFDNTYTSGRNRSHLNSNTSTMQASFPFVDNGGWTSSGLVNSGLYNGFACQMSGSYISNS